MNVPEHKSILEQFHANLSIFDQPISLIFHQSVMSENLTMSEKTPIISIQISDFTKLNPSMC